MRVTVGLALCLALLAPVAPAQADDRGAAEMHFRAGEKAYKRSNFKGAAENFELAYQAFPLPEIAFSAAQAYRRRYIVENDVAYARRAAELYRAYLDQVKTGKRVKDASDNLAEMNAVLRALPQSAKPAPAGPPAAMMPAAARTTIAVMPDIAAERGGANMREVSELGMSDDDVMYAVTLDGKPVPAFEMIDVTAGPHQIHVEAAGYQPVDTTVRAVAGASKLEPVILTPKPARIALATEAGAYVRVDGRRVGVAPLAPVELAAGRHVVVVGRRGREPRAHEVVLGRGETQQVAAPLEPTTQRRLVPWVAATAGVLALGAGAAATFAIIQDGRASDQLRAIEQGDQLPQSLADYNDHRASRDRYSAVAWWTGGAALLVGGLATALFVFDTPTDDGVQVIPTATAQGGAVSVRGRF